MKGMQRHQFTNDGLTLSYLDEGGAGRVVIALPAHWMEATTYAPLAAALAPAWRVVALDQRGHGYSDHAPREGGYTRAAYLGDLDALFRQLGTPDAVLLGNSLGGVNAYQFAARHPGRVRGLVVEDIGAVLADDTSFTLPWAGVFPSREALAERVGPRFLPYLEDAFRQTAAGWRLAFDPHDMLASQAQLNGDHWADWLATACPALLVHGRESRVTTTAMVEEMAARRPNTRLVTLDGGHVVHLDNPADFAAAVRSFLQEL
ncbi:MAG: alpha/beta hydrolase [Thermoanaerobaculaceae bacterium]|nr:alpha/beta hydrolase [Thermoanaerobaculaceae bacterium]